MDLSSFHAFNDSVNESEQEVNSKNNELFHLTEEEVRINLQHLTKDEIVNAVAKLLTDSNLEEWDSLANEEKAKRREASLIKIQNLFIAKDEAEKRKRTDSNVSATAQEPSTKKPRCCSVCNAPGKRMTHIDCPGHYRHSLPPSQDFLIEKIVRKMQWRDREDSEDEDSFYYEVKWVGGVDQPKLVPYSWVVNNYPYDVLPDV